jgi:hypothetical protein
VARAAKDRADDAELPRLRGDNCDRYLLIRGNRHRYFHYALYEESVLVEGGVMISAFSFGKTESFVRLTKGVPI